MVIVVVRQVTVFTWILKLVYLCETSIFNVILLVKYWTSCHVVLTLLDHYYCLRSIMIIVKAVIYKFVLLILIVTITVYITTSLIVIVVHYDYCGIWNNS